MVDASAADRIRVLVLFGGRSDHSVSCLSAGRVLDHLDRERFDVLGVCITPDGSWVLGPSEGGALALRGRQLPAITAGDAVALPVGAAPRGPGAGRELISLDPAHVGEVVGTVDVVFPVVHGLGGDDGTVQGLFETVGVPYVGPGVCASAVAMDKDVTKRLLRADGIPVVDAAVVLRSSLDGTTGGTLTDAERERLGLPVFVKPARAGSSVGISRVTGWGQLDAAVALAREIDSKVLVEAAVEGREIECGVLEFPDGRVETSVPAEIRITGGDAGWYDFDTKYLDDACELDVPANLDDAVADAVRELAVRVFAALGCSGLARVDFFLTSEGRPVVNEINTIPGFTATSLYPRMWAATGIDFSTLLTTLVETAWARGVGVR
jgi:D-alanine-D-alanine ligase